MRIGIYQVYWGRVGGGQRYIGTIAQLLAQKHQVEVVHHCDDFDRATVEEALELDLSDVAFRYVPLIERPAWLTRNPLTRFRLEREHRAEISQPYDLFIDNSDIPPLFCHAARGVLIVHFPLVSFGEFHGYATEDWRCRPAPVKWMSRLLHRWEWKHRLKDYQLFVVNSAYGKRWLKRLWGLDAQILNPPRRDGFVPRSKERLILMIGAFRHGAHRETRRDHRRLQGNVRSGLARLALRHGRRLRSLPKTGPTCKRSASEQPAIPSSSLPIWAALSSGRSWNTRRCSGTAWVMALTRRRNRG